MAHSIQTKLRGLVAAFVAVFAALALVPGTAFALTNDSTGSVTINGLQPGDTVTLYKVVDTTYSDPLEGGNNTLTHSWNSSIGSYMQTTFNMTIDDYQASVSDAAGTGEVAANIHAAVNAAIQSGSAEAHPAQGQLIGENGIFELSGLKMGEYLVVVAPAAGTARTYQNMIVSVQPTATDKGTWTDPVMGTEVDQPKYTEDTDVSKDVVEDGQVVENPVGYKPGDQVEFQIASRIPYYDPNTDFDSTTFKINDTSNNISLPQDKGDYVVTGDGVTIDADDYDFVWTDANNVSFTFTGDGLMAHQGEQIVITYTGTITDDLGHEDTATNTATVDPGNDTDTSNETVTFEFYQVTGTKVDAEDKEALQGAVFSIYRESNGRDGLQPDGDNADELVAADVTSGPEGSFSVDGLAEGDYYLVETQAPAGYEPLTGSVPFHTNKADVNNVISLGNIENSKDEGVHLPTTGGPGTIALTAAGVVLVAGAAAFIVRSRKQD